MSTIKLSVKNTYYLLLLILLPFACTKDVMINAKSISGAWVLTQTSGGMTGTIPMPAGKNTLLIEASGSYAKATDGVTNESGNFTITTGKTIFGDQNKSIAHFKATSGYNYDAVVELNGDILSLNQNAYDGVNSLYTREK